MQVFCVDAGRSELRRTVDLRCPGFHRSVMDGSQQIAPARTDSSVTSISNGICVPRESNLTPPDRNICSVMCLRESGSPGSAPL